MATISNGRRTLIWVVVLVWLTAVGGVVGQEDEETSSSSSRSASTRSTETTTSSTRRPSTTTTTPIESLIPAGLILHPDLSDTDALAPGEVGNVIHSPWDGNHTAEQYLHDIDPSHELDPRVRDRLAGQFFASDPCHRGDCSPLYDGVNVTLLRQNKLRNEYIKAEEKVRCMDKIGFYKNIETIFLDANNKKYDYKLSSAYTYNGIVSYNGTVRGALNQNDTIELLTVSYAQCKATCGNIVDYYDWERMQYTISTWLLPILGIVVAMPFESNKLWATIMMVIRWLGNPVTCFAVVMWNIRVTAKCGKMADMAEASELFESEMVSMQREGRIHEAKGDAESMRGLIIEEEEEVDMPRPRPQSTAYLGVQESDIADRYSPDSMAHTTLAGSQTSHALPSGFQPIPQHSPNRPTFGSIVEVAQQPEQTEQTTPQRQHGCFWTWAINFNRRWLRKTSALEAESIYGAFKFKDNKKETTAYRYPPAISELRDSLYILSIINQFETDERIPEVLWYALFTPAHTNKNKSPSLDQIERPRLDYVATRRDIATFCRRDRKRGVVALLASQLWFIISFFMNIISSFADRGSNHKAHSLGLGIFFCWLPMLSIASLVDRNSVHTEEIRDMITSFLIQVAYDRQIDLPSTPLAFFAGQGRRKFHYGVADQLLELLERRINFLQTKPNEVVNDSKALDRGWSKYYTSGQLVNVWKYRDLKQIRRKPVRSASSSSSLFGLRRAPSKTETLEKELAIVPASRQDAFDIEEVWQVIGSFIMVLLPLSGAFVISFNTPTIGLSCRSGGYMVFGILVSCVFFLEMLGWHRIFQPTSRDPRPRLALSAFLTLFETANFVYLVWFLTSMTIGAFNTCFCRSSMWFGGRGAGYATFADDKVSWLFKQNFNLTFYWLLATALGALPLLAGIAYCVLEWCLQSHLWSDQESKARHGLVMVRMWRRGTYWVYRSALMVLRIPYFVVMWRGLRYPLIWRKWRGPGRVPVGKERGWEGYA